LVKSQNEVEYARNIRVSILGGKPELDRQSSLTLLYNDGVRFGSWGMSMYSISCSVYSFNIQSLNNYFGMCVIFFFWNFFSFPKELNEFILVLN
jgi:hypothetical protein